MTFKGRIIDENNEPLFGVNIILPNIQSNFGTPIGISTDIDGNFSIYNSNINDNSEVQITYVGFMTLKTTVGKLNNKNIVLFESQLQGDEVTVIGTRQKNNWNWFLIALGTFAGYKILTSEKVKKITI